MFPAENPKAYFQKEKLCFIRKGKTEEGGVFLSETVCTVPFFTNFRQNDKIKASMGVIFCTAYMYGAAHWCSDLRLLFPYQRRL